MIHQTSASPLPCIFSSYSYKKHVSVAGYVPGLSANQGATSEMVSQGKEEEIEVMKDYCHKAIPPLSYLDSVVVRTEKITAPFIVFLTEREKHFSRLEFKKFLFFPERSLERLL